MYTRECDVPRGRRIRKFKAGRHKIRESHHFLPSVSLMPYVNRGLLKCYKTRVKKLGRQKNSLSPTELRPWVKLCMDVRT